MAKGISLILSRSDGVYDISPLVSEVRWKGRKGSASRSIKATLLDDDGYGHDRSGVDVEDGQQVLFSYDGTELFRGLVMNQTQNQKKRLTLTAYDTGIYLSNNQDTFTYENKTASQVFRDVCRRFSIPVGSVASCSYVIPELVESRATAWDAIADALSMDYENTGVRHFVTADKGKVNLLTRRDNIVQWVIEPGVNLSTYKYTKSIEDLKTRVKLIASADETTTWAYWQNNTWEKKIGRFQYFETQDDAFTPAQLLDLAKSMQEEKGTPTRTLEVDALGIPDVISGVGVFIYITALGLNRTFYVDSDTHTFTDNMHTMNLTLNYANDI